MDNLKTKRLCHHCIGEKYLGDEVKRRGQRGYCSYCGRRAQTYSLKKIASRVEAAFKQHYRRTSEQPDLWERALLSDREFDYEWERQGEPVILEISKAAEISELAAQDIQSILKDEFFDFESATMGEETEFSSESYYELKAPSDCGWKEEWNYFERSLKTEARFFSRTAVEQLASIFNGIDKMSTADGRPLIVSAGPQMTLAAFFRARVFQSNKKLEEALARPDQGLGPPPSVFALAGRMNAHGISVFYGANDPRVAIAEVRPPVGSQVAVARFEIIRPLRLLDLTALSSVNEDGSIFDPEWAARLERLAFLRTLTRRIMKPVMPDDEAFEYLPTQAIADFLATENKSRVDGMLFSSVQADEGLNVVLFNKASRVESMDIPDGTEIKVHTGYMRENGWEVDYTVNEQVPPEKTSNNENQEEKCSFFTPFIHDKGQPHDPRQEALRVDVESITVHVISSAHFQYESYDVRRYGREKSDGES